MHIDYGFTKGGNMAHIFRRLFHMSLSIFFWFMYKILSYVELTWHMSPVKVLFTFMIVLILVEMLRLYFGWCLWGMRTYESKKPCAFFWGGIGMILVMLFVPGGVTSGQKYAYPIVWCFAFIDPVMGELRMRAVPAWLMWLIGLMLGVLIWYMAGVWLGTPLWLACVMPLVVMIAEWPSWSWVNDNFFMQLLPLLLLYVLKPWL